MPVLFFNDSFTICTSVIFCGSGSTLKKEAGSGSKLGSIWLFEELEA